MDATNSSLILAEAGKITSSQAQTVAYDWSLEFKVKDSYTGEFKMTDNDYTLVPKEEKDEKIFTPFKVLNIDFIDDYEKHTFQEIKARVVIPLGMWVKCLYGARNDLLAIVRRVPLANTTYEVLQDAEVEEFVYDCIFHLKQNQNFEANAHASSSRTDLDIRGELLEIDVELLCRNVELVRKVTVGGKYRNAKPEDTIKNILSSFTEDLEVEGSKAINSISMVDAINTEKRDHIIIPHGMPLLDAPLYIQKHCGGVYNVGLNCYAVEDKIFVYPVYQTDRFEKEKKTLTVYKIPTNVAPQVEQSFMVDGDALFVLGLSDAAFGDQSLPKKLASGSGVRHTDSRKF